MAAPDAAIQSSSHCCGFSSGGVATLSRKSKRSAACIQEVSTLLASPVQATVFFLIEPRCSSKVITSAITWQGCDCLVSALMIGTRGVLRQLGDEIVLEGADHDRIDEARHHPRGVGNRFAAAELHLLPGQRDDIAAELLHRDLERDPRAGRWLVEDHRQRLAGERMLAAAPRLLHRARSRDDRAQVRRRNIDQIDEMADAALGHQTAAGLTGFAAWDERFAGAFDHGDAVGDVGLVDDQRRQQPHDIVAGRDRQHLFVAERRDHRRCSAPRRRSPSSRPSPRTSAITDG